MSLAATQQSEQLSHPRREGVRLTEQHIKGPPASHGLTHAFLTRSRSVTHTHTHTPGHDSQGEVLLWVAAVPKKPRPQLYADDAKDEEDKEAEEEDVAQHRQGVEQQVHQDAHA